MRKFALGILVSLFLLSPAIAQYNPNSIVAPGDFPVAKPYPLSPTMNYKWLSGADGGGTNDNCAAITAAMSYASSHSGTAIVVPSGTYAIASATCSAFQVPNNTTVQCLDGATFKLTGSGELNALFTSVNPNNVWFIGCGFYGNSISTNNGIGGALYFHASNTATGPSSNFGCLRCTFSNFKQPYWAFVLNDSSYPIYGARFIDDSCYSFSGNMQNSTNIGYPSACIAFMGQYSNVAGLIYDSWVDRLYVDCTWIKTGVIFWEGTDGGWLTNSRIDNCGANAGDNDGAYGTFAYWQDPGSVSAAIPTRIHWLHNIITNPRSVGIYGAQGDSLEATGNYISGQTDTTTANPDVKGAIGFGGVTNSEISNNILVNNYKGIVLRGSGDTMNHAKGNLILSNVSNAIGIIAQGQSGLTTTSTRSLFTGNTVNISGTGGKALEVLSNSGSSVTPGYVKIEGGRYTGVSNDLVSFDATTLGGAVSQGIDVTGAYFGGPTLLPIQHINTATPLLLQSITIDVPSCPSNCVGLDIRGATDVNIANVRSMNLNLGAGVMFKATGAQGSLTGWQWDNVATANRITSTDFGTAVPTWSARQGTFIQNLNPTGAGHLHGYTNTSSGSGTTWTED